MPYDPDFISECTIALPIISDRLLPQAYNGASPVNHLRYTFVFNQTRLLSFYTAHNIDGSSLISSKRISRKKNMKSDPDIPQNIQLKNTHGYKNNDWDQGHLVKRTAMHWGSDIQLATDADHETFYWTNIVPQHKNLHDHPWGKIEDWMVELIESQEKEVSIFTGPVFSEDDPLIPNPRNTIAKIPAGFWKIIAFKKNQRLTSAGFLVWQRDYDKLMPESFSPVLEQVRITTIEYLTGLSFLDLRSTDTLLFESLDHPTVSHSLPPPDTQIEARLAPSNSKGSIITGKYDIVLK